MKFGAKEGEEWPVRESLICFSLLIKEAPLIKSTLKVLTKGKRKRMEVKQIDFVF